jgi:hypothetical protein
MVEKSCGKRSTLLFRNTGIVPAGHGIRPSCAFVVLVADEYLKGKPFG